MGDVDELAVAQTPTGADDGRLLAALRRGDEQAFAGLVDRYHASMVRVARAYVSTSEAAEDVAQEAWLGIIRGLDRFEGRSSIKTWIFRILINRAITKGTRDKRTVPFSALGPDEAPVDSERFHQAGRWAGWWLRDDAVTQFPDRVVLAKESRGIIDGVVATLPPNQRLVITLRDIQGFDAQETCDLLGVSESNQRVLLHRARSKVRSELERSLGEPVGAGQ